jgi:FMN phosphatase YigB (HAD superfamily)
MTIAAKWVGFDFGQGICDGSPERTYWMIGDTSKELGQPELVDLRCHRWRTMRERYGSWAAIKEGHRAEIASYVFDGLPGAAETFSRIEQSYLKVAPGAIEAVEYLLAQDIEVSICAELKRTLGPIGTDIVSLFLVNHNIIHYFKDLISPQGKVNLRDGSVDLRYKGSSKETGTLYDLLVEELRERGIKPSEAVMVGDKEWSDITPAQARGLKTIQYAGFTFRGASNADHVIRHFSELKNLITGAK